jgi:hypothetical protein
MPMHLAASRYSDKVDQLHTVFISARYRAAGPVLLGVEADLPQGAAAVSQFDGGGDDVKETMTHYMQLLASNQPWNLLIFMAIPVILAETVAISELFLLFKRGAYPRLQRVNNVAGIVLGFYFLGVFLYLMKTAAIPLTTGGGWRGVGDVIAVGFYLFGVVPLLGIALLNVGALGRNWTAERRLGWQVSFVGTFLATAHIAMIFGMLNPHLLMPSSSTEMAIENSAAPMGALTVIGVVLVVGIVGAIALSAARRSKPSTETSQI